ncbi:hypothetical protein [Mucilaginibacter sp. OK283]|jgi:hypothetical protein|nr:hypothetical protein [Mucilaginibacter sp. OK283]
MLRYDEPADGFLTVEKAGRSFAGLTCPMAITIITALSKSNSGVF